MSENVVLAKESVDTTAASETKQASQAQQQQ